MRTIELSRASVKSAAGNEEAMYAAAWLQANLYLTETAADHVRDS
jgi:hypothetical protein